MTNPISSRTQSVLRRSSGIKKIKVSNNALRDCLGNAFSALPAVIQHAHQGNIHLSGTVRVDHGRGVAGLVARMMHLPQQNPRCSMTVDGEHHPDRMIWVRHFNGQPFASTFIKRGRFLVEKMGSIALVLEPTVQAGRLLYHLHHASIGSIPLPRFLAPRLSAWEGDADGRYEFEVEIGLPLIGRIIRYAGVLDLIPSTPADR